MTKETIVENCQRLHAFYNGVLPYLPIEETASKFKRGVSGLDLLQWYARCLDVNGCPVSGLSMLFIKDKSEFDEMKELATINQWDNYMEHNEENIPESLKKVLRENPEAMLAVIPKISFQYLGYNWEIINK